MSPLIKTDVYKYQSTGNRSLNGWLQSSKFPRYVFLLRILKRIKQKDVCAWGRRMWSVGWGSWLSIHRVPGRPRCSWEMLSAVCSVHRCCLLYRGSVTSSISKEPGVQREGLNSDPQHLRKWQHMIAFLVLGRQILENSRVCWLVELLTQWSPVWNSVSKTKVKTNGGRHPRSTSGFQLHKHTHVHPHRHAHLYTAPSIL